METKNKPMKVRMMAIMGGAHHHHIPRRTEV
jgi:hypothetical protein